MIKYGYLFFSVLEAATVFVAIVFVIALITIIIYQGNFLEFVFIYPKVIELTLIAVTSTMLVGIYILMHHNDQYTLSQIKKCCTNIQ